MPPRGDEKGTKRARQYEHIKESAREQGESKSRAKEIAARTVQKERARSGEARTRSRTSTQDMSSSRRAAIWNRSTEGTHPRPALQRGAQAEHRRPLEDEQGATPASRRSQEEQ